MTDELTLSADDVQAVAQALLEAQEAADEKAQSIWLDGKPYTVDDLSYREQREMRQLACSLVESGSIEDATEPEITPAMVCVIRRRDEPEYTLDQALDVKPRDLEEPESPPRKRGSSKS